MKPKLNEEILTAYALGELDGASRAAIEKELANNPEAREMVEEIRAVGELATAAFSAQAGPVVTDTKMADEVFTSVEPSASKPAGNGSVTQYRIARGPIALAAMALICIGIFAALSPHTKTSFRSQLAKFSLGDSMAPNPQRVSIPPDDPQRQIDALGSRVEVDDGAFSYREAPISVEEIARRQATVQLLQKSEQNLQNLQDALEAVEQSQVRTQVAADKPVSDFDEFSVFNYTISDHENDSAPGSGATLGIKPVGADNPSVGGPGPSAQVAPAAKPGTATRVQQSDLQNVEVGSSIPVSWDFVPIAQANEPSEAVISLEETARRYAGKAGAQLTPDHTDPTTPGAAADTTVGLFSTAGQQGQAPPPSKEKVELGIAPVPLLGYLTENRPADPKDGRYRVADRPDEHPIQPVPPAPQVSPGSETYSFIQDNPFIAVARQPLSTFSIDVDTASYSNMRRFLTQNTRPPKNAVRIEELINYFSYDYAPPEGEDPFSAHIEVASSPWNQGMRLVRIGLKGWELTEEERPPTNLVFLIDVSGSMRPANKLPLLKQGLAMLVRQMHEEDRVAMVVYAGSSGLVLPSTPGNRQSVILGALDRLNAGGSTNGGAGIELAYNTAVLNFIPGGVNRVILATDGDFNVGITDRNALVSLIEAKAKSGVFLSVLGFGMGNLQDDNLEGLANKGNGNYAYIDTLREARKVLVEEMAGTLVTIAKDVKIQVEFNPAQVKAYRLVGYENRLLAARDFNDDTKDAGEIGAGHTVTALYEIVTKDGVFPVAGVDALKYQTPQPAKTEIVEGPGNGELLTVKLRYKQPDGNTSKLLEFPVMDEGAMIGQASTDFRFAASVAGFGMLLCNGTSAAQGLSFEAVRSLVQSALGDDRNGYRAEFLSLVDQARQLIAPQQYFPNTVTLKGISIQSGGAVVHLQTPQGEFRLGQGAQGGGYRILSIDASAGCVDIYNLSTGQRSRICV